jgi:hypothetical protein
VALARRLGGSWTSWGALGRRVATPVWCLMGGVGGDDLCGSLSVG